MANERVFVKQEEDGLAATGFPMSVAIGVGAGMQYPALTRLFEAPYELACRQRRFSLRNLRKTPKRKWHRRTDKMQLLPSELAAVLRTGPAICKTRVDAIVVPVLMPGQRAARATALEREALYAMLDQNTLTPEDDTSYPDWGGLRQRESPDP